ncbi:MAG: UbiA family prenyltransferase [Deltaproteobacteria bacterium]|nr:UbiA family prenyltransferase [Deltaproteobacteria bacterium]
MTEEKPDILALDLDGTLLGTDSLWELFFKALSLGRLAPLAWLVSGRLAFKKRLAETVELDFDRLPWNQRVIDLAMAHREAGGEVWLATAANEAMAVKVCARFDFFSGYLASDDKINLKSRAKARELSGRFGRGKYAYAGDSRADVAVWAEADRAIVVNSGRLSRLARPLSGKVEVIAPVGTKSPSLGQILSAARAYQWVKNIILFVPIFLAHAFSAANFGRVFLAFIVFCLFSSAGYIINDLLDIDSDRRHPSKHNRPFASGAIDLSRGGLIFLGALVGGLVIASLVGQLFILLAGIYLVSAVLYSLRFKSVAILDVIVLTLLYTLRILAGGQAVGLEVSQWLLSFSFFTFASLSLFKRLTELKRLTQAAASENTRRPYVAADAGFIRSIAAGSICCAVLTLAIYVGDAAARKYYGFPGLLLAFCPILFYWLARLLKLADEGKIDYDPIIFVLSDRQSWICLGLGIVIYFCASLGVSV